MNTKQQLSTTISDYDYQYLRFLSYYNGLPVNAIITSLLEDDRAENIQLARIFDGLYRQQQGQ
ncbi:hypothetical protein SAMN04487895_10683 [Paenibacillus sophorae]|uniref:Uncharacterized protein n=1 Tax=Paenibacillus sophorae TaxID=1333845 RepID=A0A1H8N6V7_9BACL|nr:hypothetical protein SAMN04487895_10683 [Paenibacillus sophorae]